MTKYKIAKKMGVSHQAVYRWYNGHSMPNAKNVAALAKLLKKDFDTILKEFSKKKKK